MHEEIKTMSIGEAISWSQSHGVLKGEAVVMVGPFKQEDNTLDESTIRESQIHFSEGNHCETCCSI